MKEYINRLELSWVDKYKEINLEPRILIEDTEKNYGDSYAENILIHGDNLLALKSIEKEFTGKIKCIYIDPPFNTGAAFDHYDDRLEHSIWLNLMYKRLQILHRLLKEDGVIAIQLDDNESAYLKVMLDEIFGRSNYLNQITVSTNKSFGFKSTSNGLFKQANHILIYVKEKSKLKINSDKLFIEREYDKAYNLVFENIDKEEKYWTWRNINEVVANNLGYKNSKECKKEIGIDTFNLEVSLFALENSYRVFQCASVTGGAYLKRKDTIEYSKKNKDKIVRHPNDDMDYKFIGGRRVIPYSDRMINIDGVKVPGQLITDIWTDISIEGLAKEGGVDFPKGKKPEKLISRIIDIFSEKGDWVLDSFLGSGTTSAVAHKMNRKWIGIELGNQCYTHCLKRLKDVVDGKDKTGISKFVNWNGGGGFKFYELAPSLLKEDKFGNLVIDNRYNKEDLVMTLCKQEGFKYSPDKDIFWKQGYSYEKDYIFVTSNFISPEYLDTLYNDMKNDESLLICCKAYHPSCIDKYENINIKKIPQSLFGKFEYGKDNYNLNVIESNDIEGFNEDTDDNKGELAYE